MGATYKRAVQVITILVLVAVTAFGAGCFSGSTGYGYLRGTTIDAFTGEPLAVKATVYVGSRYTLVTYDGTFATGRLSPGTYSLTVSASGYAERTIPVVIAASEDHPCGRQGRRKPSAGHATTSATPRWSTTPYISPAGSGFAHHVAAAPVQPRLRPDRHGCNRHPRRACKSAKPPQYPMRSSEPPSRRKAT